MITFADVKYLGDNEMGLKKYLWIIAEDGVTTVFSVNGYKRTNIASFSSFTEALNTFVTKFEELCEPNIYEATLRKPTRI